MKMGHIFILVLQILQIQKLFREKKLNWFGFLELNINSLSLQPSIMSIDICYPEVKREAMYHFYRVKLF